MILLILLIALPFLGWFIATSIFDMFVPKEKYHDYNYKIEDYEEDISLPHINETPKKIEYLNLKDAINKIEIIKQVDDFEDTTSIYFNNVTEDDFRYLPMYFEKIGDYISFNHIGISFSIFELNIFLNVYSTVTEMGLAKGDRLIFIFEDDEKIEVIFSNARINGFPKSNSYLITPLELKKFSSVRLKKWKLISSRRNLYVIGDNTLISESSNVNKREIVQDIIKYLAEAIAIEFMKLDGQKLG